MSKEHPECYCGEFSFRWNFRKVDDVERTEAAISMAGGKRGVLSMDKLKEAIVYFASQREIYNLGRTKLAKLLYYADFSFYAEHGKSITETTYVKEEHGPLPRDFYEAIETLEKEDAIAQKLEYTPAGIRIGVIAKRDPDYSKFSSEEIATLQKIGRRFSSHTGTDLKKLSHDEPPWVLTENMLDEIDYELSHYLNLEDEVELESHDKDPEFIKSLRIIVNRAIKCQEK